MKQKFSTSWIGSVQPRKQRKFRFNAPLHVRHRFLSAHLSKELKKKYDKRSVALRKGDEVLIMRGNFAKKKGKIIEIDLRKSRVSVENINRQKKDGTKVNVYLNPSNLLVQSLNLEDGKRLKRARKEEKKEKPETKKETETKKTEEKNNAHNKNTSN
jgi:large subunit ribosomal protein L24